MRLGSGAGMGQKPDDFRTVSLCRDCHQRQHSVGEATFWENATTADVEALISAFAKASPKAAEIAQIRKERGI